ncbi:MAG: hypothetical protein ACI9FN_000163 [Saprospiraceae bacterium]
MVNQFSKIKLSRLKPFLEEKVKAYNRIDFIENDPISIPHSYTRNQDIELTAFWTAMFSWGQRKTIISKSKELFNLMDNAPYDFIKGHKEKDRKRFLNFRHRTFQPDDTLYFLEFLQHFYNNNSSLEAAFCPPDKNITTKERLQYFHNEFFSLPTALPRTRKHVSTPLRKSSCKRLNMFLRWMVRRDQNGVDFGLWNKIKPSDLMIPLDVHVFRVAKSLKLLQRDKTDWQAVEELTANLRILDPNDPVKYDYALFSIGVLEKDHLPI